MEKSLLSFATTYPGWEPGAAAKQMLSGLRLLAPAAGDDAGIGGGAAAAGGEANSSGCHVAPPLGRHYPVTSHLGNAQRPGELQSAGLCSTGAHVHWRKPHLVNICRDGYAACCSSAHSIQWHLMQVYLVPFLSVVEQLVMHGSVWKDTQPFSEGKLVLRRRDAQPLWRAAERGPAAAECRAVDVARHAAAAQHVCLRRDARPGVGRDSALMAGRWRRRWRRLVGDGAGGRKHLGGGGGGGVRVPP